MLFLKSQDLFSCEINKNKTVYIIIKSTYRKYISKVSFTNIILSLLSVGNLSWFNVMCNYNTNCFIIYILIHGLLLTIKPILLVCWIIINNKWFSVPISK